MISLLAFAWFLLGAFLLGYWVGFLKDEGEYYSRKEEREGMLFWGLAMSFGMCGLNLAFGLFSSLADFARDLAEELGLEASKYAVQVDLFQFVAAQLGVFLVAYFLTSSFWAIGYRLGCKNSRKYARRPPP